MPASHDEALCLRHWDFSETSQTVLLFARAHGLVRALAKGSRRPKHPFSGGIDVLTRGRIGVILRPQSELALLTEWDIVETFPALRASLKVHHAGLFIADALHHAITDHDPHAALYDATIETLRLMAAPADITPALLKFLWALLVETGYRPVLDADVRTGETLPPARSYRFAPDLGGLTADSPQSPAEESRAAQSGRIRQSTIELLRALDRSGLAGAADSGSDPQSPERAARFLASYLRYVLGAEPPSMPLVFGHRLAR